MCSTNLRQKLISLTLLSLIIISLIVISLLENINASASDTVPSEILDLFINYSQDLSNIGAISSEYYSPEMEMLILDRRNFYTEFFEKGLHSNLVSLKSQFKMVENATISRTGNLNLVHIIEEITLRGTPIVTSPDDYPLVQAAKWAIDHTSDMVVRDRLSNYIESITEGVENSVNDGVLVVFNVQHDMEISIENGQAKILKDSFSDKSSDNGDGFDNVTWTKNQFIRRVPDWQKMLDYEIYQLPIETMGESLLLDYELVAKSGLTPPTSQVENSNAHRDNAVWYIQYYTSNPTPMHLCPDNVTLVYRNSAYYNATYANIWAEPSLECNDCTDYVSQALLHGGFPSDDTWKPDPLNLAWTRVSDFMNYFSDPIKNRGSWVSNLASLTPGDLVFIFDDYYENPWRHVAMYSQVNPSGYSAHTNDRLNYAIAPAFNRFLLINYYQPQSQTIFLPVVFNSEYTESVMGDFIQNPYPDPAQFYQATPENNAYPTP